MHNFSVYIPRVLYYESIRKERKSQANLTPPPTPQGQSGGSKEPGEAGGKTLSPYILPMSDNLSTTRPQTKGRRVTNIRVPLDRRYHKGCTPIPIIMMYLYDSNLPKDANGPPSQKRGRAPPRGAAVDAHKIRISRHPNTMAAPGLRPVPPARHTRPGLSSCARLYSEARRPERSRAPPALPPQGQGRPLIYAEFGYSSSSRALLCSEPRMCTFRITPRTSRINSTPGHCSILRPLLMAPAQIHAEATSLNGADC